MAKNLPVKYAARESATCTSTRSPQATRRALTARLNSTVGNAGPCVRAGGQMDGPEIGDLAHGRRAVRDSFTHDSWRAVDGGEIPGIPRESRVTTLAGGRFMGYRADPH